MKIPRSLHRLGMSITSLLISVSPVCADYQNNTITLPTQYGISSESLALGSIEGLHPKAYALFENAAALSSDSHSHYSVFYIKLADQTSDYITVSAAYPLGIGHIGLGFAQKRSSDLDSPQVDNNGEFIDGSTFSQADTLYKLGYQLPISASLSLGTSVHYYSQDLYLTKGNGWNVDVGAQLQSGNFVWSFALKNCLTDNPVDYSNDYQSLHFPFSQILSTRYIFSDNIAVYGQVSRENDTLLTAAAIQYTPYPIIDLSAGFREVEANGSHPEYTLGISLKLHPVSIHFSYQKTQVNSNDHLYGISLDFGG